MAGEIIARKGSVVNELILLERGAIDVTIILDSGLLFSRRNWRAPHLMGAVALFSNSNHYRVDVEATEECEVVYVKREDVELQMMKCRRFMRNFISHAIDKFDVVTEHLNQLTQKGLSGKLAYYILKSNGDSYHFDKSVGGLPYLCVERPSLSRSIAS